MNDIAFVEDDYAKNGWLIWVATGLVALMILGVWMGTA